MLTRLETMEQELIQHIRTSGVSQSRELSLIDEVMNIRTERRKLFSVMNKMVHELQQVCDDSKRGIVMKDDEISSLIAKHRSLQDINDQLLQDMADREVHYRDKYKEDVEVEMKKMSAVHDKHIQALNINHLEKIRLLESKIEEVQQMRVAVDQQSARKVAVGLLESAKEEMMRKYNKKIAEKRSCSEWASMSEQCLLSMTSNMIQQHAELYEALWWPWKSGSLPCLCEVT